MFYVLNARTFVKSYKKHIFNKDGPSNKLVRGLELVVMSTESFVTNKFLCTDYSIIHVLLLGAVQAQHSWLIPRWSCYSDALLGAYAKTELEKVTFGLFKLCAMVL